MLSSSDTSPVSSPLEWGGFIIRPEDPKLADIGEAPGASGIYAWYTKDCELVYVGRATSIRDRLRQHQRQTTFTCTPTYYSFREVPYEWISGVENAHIRILRPYENTAMESATTPFYEAMKPAIEQAWRDVLPGQRARLDAKYTALAEDIAARL